MLLKKQKIEKWMLILLLMGVMGWYIWAYLLSIIPTKILQIIFFIILLFVVIYNLFSVWTHKKQEKSFVVSKKNIIYLSGAILLISIYNAFMSIWDFIIWLLILTWLFNFWYHKALFILSLSWILVRFTAFLSYYNFWLLDIEFFLPMFLSAMLSWIIVWYFIHKISSKFLEKILKTLWIFLVIYMLINVLIY